MKIIFVTAAILATTFAGQIFSSSTTVLALDDSTMDNSCINGLKLIINDMNIIYTNTKTQNWSATMIPLMALAMQAKAQISCLKKLNYKNQAIIAINAVQSLTDNRKDCFIRHLKEAYHEILIGLHKAFHGDFKGLTNSIQKAIQILQ